ncbi:MAG: cyclic nucleotide-binding domain-containing protein [Actinomycetota bacterium]
MAAEVQITFVSAIDHAPSRQLAVVMRGVLAANRKAGLRLDHVDVDSEPDRVRQLGLQSYPALVVTKDGFERGRLLGAHSHRAVLQLVLPELYADNDAIVQLRRQLDSPGEDFPRRVLKRRERVGKAARVEMLGHVSLFESLTRRQLQAVAALADELVVDEGAVIAEQDTDGDQFFVVVSGGLTVRRHGRKVATCAPGDCVGEMSLLDGGPRTATVTAKERTVLLTLDRMTFRGLLLDAPDVAVALLQTLSERLRG